MNSNLPKTNEEIIKIIQHYDVRNISGNKISSLLASQKGFATNTSKGWELTLSGKDLISKIFNITTDFDNLSKEIGFKNLLHPVIQKHAYQLFQNGDYRNAVLNSITSVFDQIRYKTGLKGDGEKLLSRAFSIKDPYLVFSDLDTESGQNDQKGFLQIFQGAYTGIRNPKAHTLEHDLTEEKAAQYMIFASLLARRIDEANLRKKE